MRYLLDVNVLVAWGWSDHSEHERTVTWISAVKKQEAVILMTSAIPQLGFVRISVQRTAGRVTVKEAGETLAGMVKSLGSRHEFLIDDRSSTHFPDWCHHASRTTDAHLFQLAEAHGAKLATLDTGIPGAFLIPAPDEQAEGSKPRGRPRN
jgi:predicted nucleic acid-binding protein